MNDPSTALQRFWLMTAAVNIVLAVFIWTLLRLRRSLKQSFYSHRNVSLLGGCIFSGFVLAVTVVNAYFSRGETYSVLLEFVGNFSKSVTLFLLIFLPFMLIFMLSVSVSNIALIRHEGMSLTNLLGAILGFFVVAASAAALFGWDLVYQYIIFPIYLSGRKWITIVDSGLQLFLCSLVCYLECLLFAGCFFGQRAARRKPSMDRDFLVVLGCAITPDGMPRPLLRGRLDRALQFARAQEAAGGKKAIIVVSGGQGADECVSEAEAMRRYLLQQGWDEKRIRMEERSENTKENMSFSRNLIEAEKPDARALFVTNNYHIFRAGLFAEELGWKADGIGSKTKWYFWPNAFVREFIALLVDRRRHHLRVALALLVCAAAVGTAVFLGLNYL